jgi:uncharacterized protein
MKIENIGAAVEKLKQILVKVFGPDTRVIMFGSAARGDCNTESDIDILVLLPGDINPRIEEEVFNIAYDIELANDVVFGTIVYSNDFWNSELAGVMPLHKNIEREGVVL